MAVHAWVPVLGVALRVQLLAKLTLNGGGTVRLWLAQPGCEARRPFRAARQARGGAVVLRLLDGVVRRKSLHAVQAVEASRGCRTKGVCLGLARRPKNDQGATPSGSCSVFLVWLSRKAWGMDDRHALSS